MTILMSNPQKEPTTYEMLGGGTISGSTPQELAEALRNSSYTPLDSLEEFMADVAKRCRAYDHDARIRTKPVSAFIEDLLKCGFLVKPQPNPPNVIAFPDNPDEEDDQ
jgi:hypothetical protein